ncbi:MAG: hypothetical protein ACLKAN_08200 [Alkaliphilus sp.]
MFGNKKDDTESIKLDIAQIKANAGKIPDSQPETQQSGIVSLSEGTGIGREKFPKDRIKEDRNKNK